MSIKDHPLTPELFKYVVGSYLSHQDRKRLLKFKSINQIPLLVELGISPLINGNYALIWACRKGNLDVIKHLVAIGADLHVDRETPF
jgi:ankyrin repeat protein